MFRFIVQSYARGTHLHGPVRSRSPAGHATPACPPLNQHTAPHIPISRCPGACTSWPDSGSPHLAPSLPPLTPSLPLTQQCHTRSHPRPRPHSHPHHRPSPAHSPPRCVYELACFLVIHEPQAVQVVLAGVLARVLAGGGIIGSSGSSVSSIAVKSPTPSQQYCSETPNSRPPPEVLQ